MPERQIKGTNHGQRGCWEKERLNKRSPPECPRSRTELYFLPFYSLLYGAGLGEDFPHSLDKKNEISLRLGMNQIVKEVIQTRNKPPDFFDVNLGGCF